MEMEKVFKAIKDNKMFASGDVVGVAVSGGIDSMSLLHFLNENKEMFDIDIVAVTVDHCIRENSAADNEFVIDYCRKNRIRCHKFRVDALKIAQEKNIGIEQAAREARYGVFDALVKKGIVDKIALAHHISDQAETIMLHILRGAGLSGATGMEYVRNYYVRPFLDLSKDEVSMYAYRNEIPNVEDETNGDSSYSRNFLRNEIFPKLRQKWPTVEQNLINFGKACKEDDDYISSQLTIDAVIVAENLVKIPLNYFIFNPSLINRTIIYALNKAGITCDIERKHITMIRNLATAENGKKINLPNGTVAIKEYEYITIITKTKNVIAEQYSFGIGKIDFSGLYEITCKRTKNFTFDKNVQLLDTKKIPSNAVWRVREKGDTFEKFGGGTKPLRSYLIDKKVPSRERDIIPVLADGNKILVILGVEISDSVKLDKNTKMAYAVTYTKTQN